MKKALTPEELDLQLVTKIFNELLTRGGGNRSLVWAVSDITSIISAGDTRPVTDFDEGSNRHINAQLRQYGEAWTQRAQKKAGSSGPLPLFEATAIWLLYDAPSNMDARDVLTDVVYSNHDLLYADDLEDPVNPYVRQIQIARSYAELLKPRRWHVVDALYLSSPDGPTIGDGVTITAPTLALAVKEHVNTVRPDDGAEYVVCNADSPAPTWISFRVSSTTTYEVTEI